MFFPFFQIVYRQLHSANRDGGHVDSNRGETLVCDALGVVKVHEPMDPHNSIRSPARNHPLKAGDPVDCIL